MTKANRQVYVKIAVAALGFFLSTLTAVASGSDAGDGTAVMVSDSDLTPAPGNPLRKAVLDALRQEVKRLHGLDVVFVVQHLKVLDGWAWVHTLPQSPDGAQRYEDISALLNNLEGLWKVAEIPCAEVDNPDCLYSPEYFTGLRGRFPKLPPEILPSLGISTDPDDATQQSEDTPGIKLVAEVVGCARSEEGMATRSNADQENRHPQILVDGSTIRYSRATRHQCCRAVEFRHEYEGSKINIVEYWTGRGCRCQCFSALNANLDHIPPGEYIVTVYTTGTKPGSDEPLPESILLSQTVQVSDEQ